MQSLHQIVKCISNEYFGLTLMPTEQCNFRCTYCYEDFSIGKMTEGTIQGIKNLLKQRAPDLKHLTVSWFGGEPLAAKNVVYELGRYIKELLREYPNIHYESDMTTNGFALKGDVIKQLLDLEIRSFQISLDGPKEIHDKTRVRMNGEGSFDVIWNNLLALKSLSADFRVMIRVHVTPENYQALEDFLPIVKQTFDGDKRFGIFLKAIENLGGPNGGKFSTLGKSKFEAIERLYAMIRDMEMSPLRQKDAYICYASKVNNLVIRADGTLSKCTVVFNDERNKLGRIHDDGTIDVDAEKMNLWVRGLKSLDETTLGCPLKGLPKLEGQRIPVPISVQVG